MVAERLKTGYAEQLPWPLAGALLTALGAVMLTKHESLPVALFGLPALAAYTVRMRFSSPVAWLLRLPLFGLAVLAAMWGKNNGFDDLIDVHWLNGFAYLCAAEFTVQVWLKRPSRMALMLLPCGVFLAATNTYRPLWNHVLAPVFLLLLASGFFAYRPRASARPWVVTLVGLAILLATVGLGVAFTVGVDTYRAALNVWGERMLMQYPRGQYGISLDPQLGRGPGASSTERVMRVQGFEGIYYLRGLAFDTYSRGRWLPGVMDRSISTIPSNQAMAGYLVHVIKLMPLDDLLFVPLNTEAVNAPGMVGWSPEDGGPIQTASRNVMEYNFSLAINKSHTFWPAPTPAARARMLQVPETLSPGVRTLAAMIGGRSRAPEDRVQAVTLYLLTKYQYGDDISPGNGDQVSSFILEHKKAHCEYFASAAVLLLRCLGVPARYVVGYYAHELDPNGGLVVRQRDAHAWAEAWVDGVGWMTVETTPSSGRPDAALENQPSFWQYAREWLHDKLLLVRQRIARVTRRQVLIALAAVMLLYIGMLLMRVSRERRHPRVVITYILPSDRRLAELVVRFNAWLAHDDRPCPPGVPWQEHLAHGEISREAREFVLRYNMARFGNRHGDDTLAEMTELLTVLEKRER